MREDRLANLQVSAYSIGVMADVLERAGIDPAPAYVSARLDPLEPIPASGIISARSEVAFQRAFNALTPGRADLWAEVGRRHRLPAYGLYGLTLATSPTLRRWVATAGMARDLCFSFTDYRPVETCGELHGLEFWLDAVPLEIRQMTLFRDLGALSAVLEDLWRGPTDMFTIELPVSPEEGRIIASTLPFEIRFDRPRTLLTWPAKMSDIELPYGSKSMHQLYFDQCMALLNKIPGNELEARVMHVIMLNPGDHNTVNAVARRLHMSSRTLQRRLLQEGLTFRTILDRARSEVARECLRETSASITRISEKLGYADRASFDTAFARWTGRSPRKFREQMKAEGVIVAA